MIGFRLPKNAAKASALERALLNKLGMNTKRKSYPSDVSDEEWAFLPRRK
jgi:hypothetical protein